MRRLNSYLTKALNMHMYTNVYKMETTIRLEQETKTELDQFRQYKNESYNELVRKVFYFFKIC